MNIEDKTLIDATARGGEQFVDLFYKYYDSQRQILQRLYKDDALLIWNGNPSAGVDAIKLFFEVLPPSKHQIQAVDCQPIIFNGDRSVISILVNVVGEVSFNETDNKPFCQNFTLVPNEAQSGNFCIKNDTFRFL
eukprot:Colp12_sorted_trinity150504_noHs@25844